MTKWLKLRSAGESVTMRVSACALAQSGRFPGYVFRGVAHDGAEVAVEVPQAATLRQLDRLGLTAQTVVGRRITIGRSDSGDASAPPYWDIDLADEGDGRDAAREPGGAAGRSPAVTAPKPPADEAAKDEADPLVRASAHYVALLAALDRAWRAEVETAPTAEALQAAAATIWIGARSDGFRPYPTHY